MVVVVMVVVVCVCARVCDVSVHACAPVSSVHTQRYAKISNLGLAS